MALCRGRDGEFPAVQTRLRTPGHASGREAAEGCLQPLRGGKPMEEHSFNMFQHVSTCFNMFQQDGTTMNNNEQQ